MVDHFDFVMCFFNSLCQSMTLSHSLLTLMNCVIVSLTAETFAGVANWLNAYEKDRRQVRLRCQFNILLEIN